MMNTKLGANGLLTVDGKILLGLRSADDPSFPGLWCVPGGGVELFETIDEAIVREYKEETGLTVDVAHQVRGGIFIGERIIPDERHTVIIFKRVFLRGPFSDLKAGDGLSKVEWFDLQELIALMKAEQLTPLSSKAIREFLHLYNEG